MQAANFWSAPECRIASRRDRILDCGIALLTALIAPLLISAIGSGPLLKIGYPAMATCAAGLLYVRKSPWYVGLCIWLFCMTPLVRRLIDEQAGWDPSNPALLSPYLACAFAGCGAFRLLRGAPEVSIRAKPFFIILGCIFYGLLLAVLDDRPLSGFVDAMKWSAGPLVALHLLQSGRQRSDYRRVPLTSLLLAVPLISAYGIAQYVNPLPWDVDWMENAQSLGLGSIGVPKPFELRVFGTMNSPGSLGAFLMFGILVAFQRRLVIMFPSTIIATVALLLTQYRAVWGGTMIGVVYLALAGPTRTSGRIAGIALTVIFAISSMALIPQMQEAVFDRLQSIDKLQADASGEDRLHQYETFLANRNEGTIIGQGLAIDGASRRLDNKDANVIDSGIIEIFSVFGIFGGTVFLLALASTIVITFSSKEGNEMPLYRAGVIAMFCQVPFGSVFVGESGFCGWVFLGLAAAASTEFSLKDELERINACNFSKTR